jgi:uncharacterized DUF497 family protein
LTVQYVVWDTDEDAEGNVQHIAEHGLTKEEIEEVLYGVHELDTSRTSGRPIAFGFTSTGIYVCIVFEWVDEGTVYPITAYPLE